MTADPNSLRLEDYLRDVPDFPKPGIVFKDITPLLASPEAFRVAVERLTEAVRHLRPTHIAAIESRGFLFGTPMAERLKASIIPLRKPGKLPWKTIEESYNLEYGSNTLEVHVDGAGPSDRVVLVDDLLATGGTGLTGRDITPEVFEGLYEKSIPGFGELFSYQSMAKIGHHALES